MRTAELTLDVVKHTSEKLGGRKRRYRLSDFASQDEIAELEAVNLRGKERKRLEFDAVDRYCAEILARFGYEAYKAWLSGEIEMERMARWLEAERCREEGVFLGLESTLTAAISSCAQSKKGLRVANKLINKQQRVANRGGK